MTLVRLTHIGNGVHIFCRSGARYRADPGQTISFLPMDAEALRDHPEWIPAQDTDYEGSEEQALEGDTDDEHS